MFKSGYALIKAAAMRWSIGQMRLDMKSHFPYKIIISIRRQTLPSWRQLLPRQSARSLLPQISLTVTSFAMLTDSYEVQPQIPLTLAPFITLLPPITPSTLDVVLLSVVKTPPLLLKISHPVTNSSSLVKLSSCSLIPRSLVEHYKHLIPL